MHCLSGSEKSLPRRRALSWPIFGLSLASLIACAGGAAAGSPALPGGGVVRAGSASIGPAAGGALTIDQTSSRAIIDWTSFSIGAGASVTFDNGAGATLNRVTGTSGSALDGALTATGSVYLINPNGVIVGKNGVVDVGGTFAASTQDLADTRFMAGGDMTFAGKSTAAVINYGRIGALGGDVALIAARVVNSGTIAAAKGDAGLLAGYQVTLRDKALSDGKFAVVLGGAGTSAANTGAIRAAEAELRANGGNVYALAGNTGGLIRADGVAAADGKVFLVAQGGTLTLAGTILSRGANGSGGRIETSGSTVEIGKAAIDAGAGGAWLLDPNDLTIDQTAANTIAASLNGGTSVTQQTTATGTGGNGDIFVAANVNLTWTTAASLTLSAYRNISLGSASLLKSTGGGALTLYADNSGDGTGTVSFAAGAKAVTGGAVSLFYDPTSYAAPTNYAPDVSAGALTAYMLVNNLTQLQAMATNLKGTYALGTDIDASASAGWNAGAGFAPIGNAASPFKGQFNGQGFTISGLVIDRPAMSQVGLFGAIGDLTTLKNLGLAGESVTGNEYVGGLLGSGAGTISGVSVTGTVSGGDYVGGLAGQDQGTITGASADAAVSGTRNFVGGLVGYDNRGQITGSWATGAVTGTQTFVGGLAGYDNAGAISQSWADGAVKGAGDVGGLVGQASGGSITGTWAAGAVTANQNYAGGLVGLANGGETIQQSWAGGAVMGANNVGGLIGRDVGALSQSYALGSVKGAANVGGLIGSSAATVSQTYATGAVSGQNGVGGLIGAKTGGSVTSSYWDTQTSGQSKSAGGAGLTTAQFFTVSNFAGFTFGTTPGAAGWVIVDDYGSLNNGCCQLGSVRPMLLSEFSTTIVNAHQLQLMALDLNADYTLGANIDASATSGANPSGMWTTAGFVPIGTFNNGSPFQGAFDGQGHTINNLNIDRPTTDDVGLFGVNQGMIENVGLVGGSISGANSVGGLVGENFGGNVGGPVESGSIVNSYNTGTVNGGSSVGGLVGWFVAGSISESYASGAITGEGSNLGGLVGFAGSNGATSNSSEFIYVSYASGSVTGTGGANSLNIGGLVGLTQGTSVIFRAFATGAVNGSNNVGGLVGNSGGQIENTYATGAVDGSNLVGGLIGRSSGVVRFSYASGPVTGVNKVGGLIGYAAASDLYSSYWDTQTTGQATSQGGTGLTAAQMKQESSFVGWDFTSYWFPPSPTLFPTLRGVP